MLFCQKHNMNMSCYYARNSSLLLAKVLDHMASGRTLYILHPSSWNVVLVLGSFIARMSNISGLPLDKHAVATS